VLRLRPSRNGKPDGLSSGRAESPARKTTAWLQMKNARINKYRDGMKLQEYEAGDSWWSPMS
jgi:hypothetical protein